MAVVVNRPPIKGHTYYLVIEVNQGPPSGIEYYARWKLPLVIGVRKRHDLTFVLDADLSRPRTVQVVSANAADSKTMQDQVDSNQEDNQPMIHLPCCTVSAVLPLTPR